MRRDDVASTLKRRHFGTKCPLGNKINGLGVGSEWVLRYEAFNEVKGVGHTQVDTRSESKNTSYHKEKDYIYLRGWDLNGFCDIRLFMK